MERNEGDNGGRGSGGVCGEVRQFEEGGVGMFFFFLNTKPGV